MEADITLTSMVETIIINLPNFAGLFLALFYAFRTIDKLTDALTALAKDCAEIESELREEIIKMDPPGASKN